MKHLLTHLKPETHSKVRDSYYKAAEGLTALKDALELADLELGRETELLTEHYTMAKLEEIFSRSPLGKYL